MTEKTNNVLDNKKHVNPFLVKKLSQSPEAKDLISKLEDLNWQVQMASWKLDKLSAIYNYKHMEYLKLIGYDITDEELDNARKLVDDLEKEQDDEFCK